MESILEIDNNTYVSSDIVLKQSETYLKNGTIKKVTFNTIKKLVQSSTPFHRFCIRTTTKFPQDATNKYVQLLITDITDTTGKLVFYYLFIKSCRTNTTGVDLSQKIFPKEITSQENDLIYLERYFQEITSQENDQAEKAEYQKILVDSLENRGNDRDDSLEDIQEDDS